MPSSEMFSPGWVGCGTTALVVVDDSLGQGEGSPADSVVREFTGNGGTDYLLEIVSGPLSRSIVVPNPLSRYQYSDGEDGHEEGSREEGAHESASAEAVQADI